MFKPVNRYVHVKLIENEAPKTQSGILLPESFKPTEERYTCVEVISVSEDIKFKEHVDCGDRIIVDKTMIDEINFMGKSINVILENYILGIIS